MSRCIRTLLSRRDSLPVLEFLIAKKLLHIHCPLAPHSSVNSIHTSLPSHPTIWFSANPSPGCNSRLDVPDCFAYRRHRQAQISSPGLASGTGKAETQSPIESSSCPSRPDPADESARCSPSWENALTSCSRSGICRARQDCTSGCVSICTRFDIVESDGRFHFTKPRACIPTHASCWIVLQVYLSLGCLESSAFRQCDRYTLHPACFLCPLDGVILSCCLRLQKAW